MPSPEPHAPSYYAASARDLRPRPALAGDRHADVCVIGGGYTGLSAALHLAEAGRDVVLIEAHRLGWGASGRNGGQLHSGQRRDVDTLEAWFGPDRAKLLFDLGEEAKRTVKDLIRRHRIACDWRDGLIHAAHRSRYLEPIRREVDKLRDVYGLDAAVLDRAQLAAAIGTDVYHGGWRDASAGHLHPLDFALGLAAAAEAAGAALHEATPALRLDPIAGGTRVITARGAVTAGEVVIACNGYLDGLEPETDAHIMPIHNYVLATAPLGAARAAALIPGREAVSDSRFVVHYWRLSADDRLIFGGGETYSRGFPADIRGFVRAYLLRIYPGLADVAIDHAWGGTLAVTMSRLPFIRRIRPGLYSAAGYSGQGLSLATFAGRLIAEAIGGDTGRFDVFAVLPARRFPGGRLLRHPSLVLAMTWYALRDRL